MFVNICEYELYVKMRILNRRENKSAGYLQSCCKRGRGLDSNRTGQIHSWKWRRRRRGAPGLSADWRSELELKRGLGLPLITVICAVWLWRKLGVRCVWRYCWSPWLCRADTRFVCTVLSARWSAAVCAVRPAGCVCPAGPGINSPERKVWSTPNCGTWCARVIRKDAAADWSRETESKLQKVM